MIAAILALLFYQTPPAPLPGFGDFAVEETFRGTPKVPLIESKGQRGYRTTIRNAAKEGPDFAGHYKVARAGCGSDCGVFFIVDVMTGRVYDLPFHVAAFPPIFVYQGGGAGVDFRINSRLMILRGCPEETACATYAYEWTGSALKLLRKTPAVELR